MKPKTLQQWFNGTWNWHIVKDEPYGYDEINKHCIYSDSTGKFKCAIGCSMTKEQLKKAIDFGANESGGLNVISLIDKEIVNYNGQWGLDKLQRLHDSCAEMKLPKEDYKEKLIDFAGEFSLTIPAKKK